MNIIAFPGLGIDAFTIKSTFSLLGFEIHYYGVIIALGIVLAYIFAVYEGKRRDISSDTILDVIIYGLPSAVVCARLYYVIFQWDYFKNNLSDIIKIWEGGIAIYGAIIGALISTYIYCGVKKISFFKMADLGAFGLLIGQAIGRWGNFVNAEAYGGPTNLPWRMELLELGISVHPTFLYESLWNICVFTVLFLYRKKQKFNGEIFLMYLTGYGLGRVWIEGLRADSLYFGPLRISQIVALVCVVAGLSLIIFFRKKAKQVETI